MRRNISPKGLACRLPDDGARRDGRAQDLLNAMRAGLSPDGRHYYPAFPYASYARATAKDIQDLHAYLMALPKSDARNLPHETVFPFGIRRRIGLRKIRHLSDEWVVTGNLGPVAERGRYLAEALGHCGECHTPRGSLGGPDEVAFRASRLANSTGARPKSPPILRTVSLQISIRREAAWQR